MPHSSTKKPATEKRGLLSQQEIIKLINGYFKGSLHNHSEPSPGPVDHFKNSTNDQRLLEYACAAGYEFIDITDHSTLAYRPKHVGLESENAKLLLKKNEKIISYNQLYKPLAILSSVEANLMFDQSQQPIIDLKDELLNKLDVVIASRHVIDKEKDIKAIKASLLAAIRHPLVDIIGHPDRHIRLDITLAAFYDEKANRLYKTLLLYENLLKETEEFNLLNPKLKKAYQNHWREIHLFENSARFKKIARDYWRMWEQVMQSLKRHNKIFEINLNAPPQKRLIKLAIKYKVRLILNFDAHTLIHYLILQLNRQAKFQTILKKWMQGRTTPQDELLIKKLHTSWQENFSALLQIRRLANYLKVLHQARVNKGLIMNASRQQLLQYLITERRKSTPNLSVLKKKFL